MLYVIICKSKKNPVHLISLGLCNKTPKEASKASAAHQERQKTPSTVPPQQAPHCCELTPEHSLLTTPLLPRTHTHTSRPLQQLFKCTFN